MTMDAYDFVEQSSQVCASKLKSVSKDDGKFVLPQPVTSKQEIGLGR